MGKVEILSGIAVALFFALGAISSRIEQRRRNFLRESDSPSEGIDISASVDEPLGTVKLTSVRAAKIGSDKNTAVVVRGFENSANSWSPDADQAASIRSVRAR